MSRLVFVAIALLAFVASCSATINSTTSLQGTFVSGCVATTASGTPVFSSTTIVIAGNVIVTTSSVGLVSGCAVANVAVVFVSTSSASIPNLNSGAGGLTQINAGATALTVTAGPSNALSQTFVSTACAPNTVGTVGSSALSLIGITCALLPVPFSCGGPANVNYGYLVDLTPNASTLYVYPGVCGTGAASNSGTVATYQRQGAAPPPVPVPVAPVPVAPVPVAPVPIAPVPVSVPVAPVPVVAPSAPVPVPVPPPSSAPPSFPNGNGQSFPTNAGSVVAPCISIVFALLCITIALMF